MTSEDNLRGAMRHSVDMHRNDVALAAAVSAGVVAGLNKAFQDKELMVKFWNEGFEHLSNSAGKGASQWVGKRILIAAIAAVFIWVMGWLFRNGAFK
jgi:hypothetical protein